MTVRRCTRSGGWGRALPRVRRTARPASRGLGHRVTAQRTFRRTARRMRSVSRVPPSRREQVAKELRGAWIVRLPEPEHCLLADLGIAIVSRDVHQLAQRLVVATL